MEEEQREREEDEIKVGGEREESLHLSFFVATKGPIDGRVEVEKERGCWVYAERGGILGSWLLAFVEFVEMVCSDGKTTTTTGSRVLEWG